MEHSPGVGANIAVGPWVGEAEVGLALGYGETVGLEVGEPEGLALGEGETLGRLVGLEVGGSVLGAASSSK